MTGEVTPGEIYSVPTLSSRLGVSATPVREAMLDLVSEGLVAPVRNRGFRVVSVSPGDLADILKLRLLLEVPSTGDVADWHRDEDMPRFRALADALPEHVRSEDFQAYLEADREFHIGLLSLLGNRRLVDIVGMLRNQSRLFDVGRLAASGALMESAVEHREIIDAIERRDRHRTEALVRKHLERLRQSWEIDELDAAAVT